MEILVHFQQFRRSFQFLKINFKFNKCIQVGQEKSKLPSFASFRQRWRRPVESEGKTVLENAWAGPVDPLRSGLTIVPNLLWKLDPIQIVSESKPSVTKNWNKSPPHFHHPQWMNLHNYYIHKIYRPCYEERKEDKRIPISAKATTMERARARPTLRVVRGSRLGGCGGLPGKIQQ